MIGVDDPCWLTTLPHLVQPLADEWLVGLLLRCDLANGWSAGITGRYLRGSPTAPPISNQTLSAFAIARSFNLPRLATVLALPLDALRQTTFEAELMRLRAPDGPDVERLAMIDDLTSPILDAHVFQDRPESPRPAPNPLTLALHWRLRGPSRPWAGTALRW